MVPENMTRPCLGFHCFTLLLFISYLEQISSCFNVHDSNIICTVYFLSLYIKEVVLSIYFVEIPLIESLSVSPDRPQRALLPDSWTPRDFSNTFDWLIVPGT